MSLQASVVICKWGHCPICAGPPPSHICCECGEVFVPWHPDIQDKYMRGEVR